MLLSFFVFVAALLLVFISSQTLFKLLTQLVSPYFIFFLFLPGILLHELSHIIMATFLNVRTGRLSLKPQINRHHLKLGSAQIAATDPFRLTLIGFAPFLSANLIIYLFFRFWLNFSSVSALPFWQLIVFFYLIFTLSNTMFSSTSDLQASGVPLTLLLLITLALTLSSFSLAYSLLSSLTTLLSFFNHFYGVIFLFNLTVILFLKLLYKNVLH